MTLDELERLERAATAGPWRAADEGGPSKRRPVWHLVDAGAYGPVVCRTGTNDMPKAEEDAAFIAAARNALPALLRVARAARALKAARADIHAEERHAWGELFAALAALAALDGK